jgi:hypothetical protein
LRVRALISVFPAFCASFALRVPRWLRTLRA